MPLKLSIGLSRKVGEANYGSRGATVGLELEADVSLVHRPEEFYEQIAHLFWLARESVDRELARQAAPCGNGAATKGTDSRQPRRLRTATPNQVRAIHAIADEQALDLVAELRDRFGVELPDNLSLVEASELIDALKSTTSETALASGGEQPLPPSTR